jgi:acyl carrier protein
VTWDKNKVDQSVDTAVLAAVEKQVEIRASDSLVLSLGFDSLRVASLAIALERELDHPILLNEWIGRCTDPAALTVGSLREYVWEVLQRDS